ncbi:glutathionylspermidine synthase family protein [Paractinoplanes rishiriensis]|uniref:glutathionylspermidine synthase family protein n=1 Tax=Paractinoplanes rishiriensis TaxID=1050105 RepID=UPI0034DB5618
MSQIGWDVTGDRVLFVPSPGSEHGPCRSTSSFMLYPWEWFWNDAARRSSATWPTSPSTARSGSSRRTRRLLSNKALLPVLWMLFGEDKERGKYLLPSYFARSSKAAVGLGRRRRVRWSSS